MPDKREVTIPVATLDTLLTEAHTTGVEVARGLKTEEQARTYIRNVVMKLAGVEVGG